MGVVEILDGLSNFPRVLIENRLLTDARIETSLVPPSGDAMTVALTMSEGLLYGGPVRGTFLLEPDTDRYQLNMFMDDVELTGIVKGESESGTEIPGRVLASLALKGITGKDDTRIGRGEIRIHDADIAGSSSSMALLRVGQLMLPGSSGLDEAEISYFIDGGEAILFAYPSGLSYAATQWQGATAFLGFLSCYPSSSTGSAWCDQRSCFRSHRHGVRH